MGRTTCTEPQCLYRGDLYLFLTVFESLFSGYILKHGSPSAAFPKTWTLKGRVREPRCHHPWHVIYTRANKYSRAQAHIHTHTVSYYYDIPLGPLSDSTSYNTDSMNTDDNARRQTRTICPHNSRTLTSSLVRIDWLHHVWKFKLHCQRRIVTSALRDTVRRSRVERFRGIPSVPHPRHSELANRH